jgi:hypothetical protein
MMRYLRTRRHRARGNRAVVQPRRGPWKKRMCRPYESAVHRPCTPHSVPLTLQVIVSDVYQQIVKQGLVAG